MSPVVSNNASTNSNPVQAVRPPEPRSRNEANAGGASAAGVEAVATPSAIVRINPAARERAQADRTAASAAEGTGQADGTGQARPATQASRPAGAAVATGGNPVSTTVSAALRAYGAAQANAPAATPTRAAQASAAQLNPTANPSRSTSAANDPTGLNNEGRTRPTRAGEPDTADAAVQAQASQQRDQAALLQGAAASATRLGNQSARVG